jgi:hypothetical protein
LVRDVDKRGRKTLEVAHEALLRTWPALTTWLIEDRDKLRQHNAIVRAAKEWDESGRKLDLLVHRDGRLKDAKKLVSERRFAFSAGSGERDYLDVCEWNQSQKETAAQEERERRLKDAERLARAEAERAEDARKLAEEQKQRAELSEQREKDQKEAARKLRRRAWILALVAFVAIAAGGLAVLGLNSALTKENPRGGESS